MSWRHAIGEGAALDPTLDLVVSPVGIVTSGQASPLQSRALEAGDLMWTSELPSWAALAESEGLVFGVSGLAVRALDATTGAERWHAPVTEGTAHLVVAPGLLIASTGSTLAAFRLADGSAAWTRALESAAATTPAIAAATMTIGLTANRLVSLDLVTGAVRWQVETFGAPETVALGPRHAYVTLTGGTACAYRLADGTLAWCFNLRIPIIGEPLLDAKLLYLTLFDNTLRGFDPTRGQLKQQERLGARPAGGPLSTTSGVFVPLRNGELAFFAAKDGRPLPRVTPGTTIASQILQRAALNRDGSLIGTLTVAPGGNQTLALYRKAAPPPPAPATVKPPPTKPAAPAKGAPGP